MNAAWRNALPVLAVLVVLVCRTSAQIIPLPPKAAADTFIPDKAAPFADFSQAWPARWGAQGDGPRGVIIPYDVPAYTLAVRFVSDVHPKQASDERDFAALCALFLEPQTITWNVESKNATPVESRLKKPRFLRTGEPDAALVFKFVSGSVSNRDGIDVVILERTAFALYEPLDGKSATHLVVLLPGMFGTPEQVIEPLINHFRTQGVAVLRMFSHPSRFTEQVQFTVDPADAADLEASAQAIATTVNSRLAECAYAVDAALDFVYLQRPLTKDLPLIALGASGGAIAVPTICALHSERWSGAILIGAAADFWLVNQRSNYQNLINALNVRWSAQPTQEQRRMLDACYLKYTVLDPFHTAKALTKVPVFLLQGENDQAVPAALGELLWDRIATTDAASKRVSTPLTHEALFATLPARFDELVEWIKARKR